MPPPWHMKYHQHIRNCVKSATLPRSFTDFLHQPRRYKSYFGRMIFTKSPWSDDERGLAPCWTPWQPLRSGWPGQALTLAQPSTNISTQPSTGASTSTTISTSTSTSYSTSTSKQKHQSAIQRGGLWRQASMGNDQVALATGLVTVGPKSHFDFFGAGSQFAATLWNGCLLGLIPMALETKLEDNSGSCNKLSILPTTSIILSLKLSLKIFYTVRTPFLEKNWGNIKGRRPMCRPKSSLPRLCALAPATCLTPFQWSHLDTKLLHSVKDFWQLDISDQLIHLIHHLFNIKLNH